MKRIYNCRRVSIFVLLSVSASVCFAAETTANIKDYGVKGDGITDDTAAVQAVLDSEVSELFFPAGTYLLGSLNVPGDTTIRFAPKAVYKINPAMLKADPTSPKPKGNRVVVLGGDNIILDGLNFDFMTSDGHELSEKDMAAVIHGEGIGHLRVTRLRAIRKTLEGMTDPHPYLDKAAFMEGKVIVVLLENCHDIEVDRCEVANVGYLVKANFCENVSVHENRAEWAANITRFNYGRGLRHYANWSRDVTFQCVWWGGNCGIPDERSNVVHRDLRQGDDGFDIQTAGVYDVSVQNNYAEYGVTLAWGSKARNVLISGNTARFMDDMAYDCEGDGNIVISNNISVNSRIAGIGCFFWADKMQITGNLIMVLDEGDDRYKGHFLRMHWWLPPSQADPGKAMASGHLFGTGKAFVSGNLFVSEVGGKKCAGDTLNRMIQIEDCRDITISGNKFVNGWIRTLPQKTSRKVTIVNNEFDNRIAGNGPAIRIDSKGTEAVIRNNIIRKTAAETDPGYKDAAIHLLADPDKQIIVEGNIIDGWRHAISCAPKNPDGKPSRYIIRNNTISGSMDFLGQPEQFRKHDAGNLNPRTLRPVTVKHIPGKELKK